MIYKRESLAPLFILTAMFPCIYLLGQKEPNDKDESTSMQFVAFHLISDCLPGSICKQIMWKLSPQKQETKPYFWQFLEQQILALAVSEKENDICSQITIVVSLANNGQCKVLYINKTIIMYWYCDWTLWRGIFASQQIQAQFSFSFVRNQCGITWFGI